MPVAIDRIPAIRDLYSGTVWGIIFGPFFAMLVLELLLLIVQRLLTRSWDRWYPTDASPISGNTASSREGFMVSVRVSPTAPRLPRDSRWRLRRWSATPRCAGHPGSRPPTRSIPLLQATSNEVCLF